MKRASLAVQNAPKNPALVRWLAQQSGQWSEFWRDGKGAEAVVCGRKLAAAAPGGKVRETSAAVLRVGRGGDVPQIGDVARELLGAEGRTTDEVLASRRRPKRATTRKPKAAEVKVYAAYTNSGRFCCWHEERKVAAASAKRSKGFVRTFMVTFGRHRIPTGIPEYVAPPWRKADHPRGGTTEIQSVLLPKEKFPTKADAAIWLVAQKKPFRADRIDDSGKVRAGRYWRARQFDPRRGVKHRAIPFGNSGIQAVIEAKGRKTAT